MTTKRTITGMEISSANIMTIEVSSTTISTTYRILTDTAISLLFTPRMARLLR